MKNKETNTESEAGFFNLPAKLDISTAVEFANALKEFCISPTIILSANAVEKITTAGVQILLATSLAQKNKGGDIRIIEPSEIFTNNLTKLGFSQQLKEWMDSNG